MNAQISFIKGEFSLIHIPLPLYSLLLQPILRVLLPYKEADSSDESEDEECSLTFDQEHGFLNISVTPIECSVVCHKSWAETIFQPIIDALPQDENNKVQISTDSYIVFSVDSTGTDAGQRVMDLTSPLAMAGIPIFFITTYYTDFILVPSKDRHAVGQTLLSRGFEFSEEESAYVVPTPNSHSRGPSSNSNPPSTPPPSNIAELQARTFKHLKRRNVKPFVQPGLRLIQCSGRDRIVEDHPMSNGNRNSVHPPSPFDKLNTRLYIAIISALIHQPTFLSLTISLEEGSSLLLDKTLLPLFGSSIQGDTDGELVPIFLDLLDLPLESTGIVCGVAGRLVDEMRLNDKPEEEGGNVFGRELSYLSTARAGAVVLSGVGK
ncbi:hypothetical protein DID88_009623 [Monilinia fructigena]|uniref:CASTOR ACT domain-containing protein n=1 Tax=Monilinia fructigena TaxID=38457 RepID=A0A395IMR4_9HELO|nr:hypothetical protein DID88_009623 [Monilinia fructigena]